MKAVLPKFTNGPWKSRFIGVYSRNKLLFSQDWWNSPNELNQAKANATLAAAAPEMYAMLEELYDNLNRGMKYIISRRVKNGCPIDLARKCSASNIELARRIKALLKKARGKE